MKKILCLICAVSTAVSVFATAPDKKDSSLEFNPHWSLTLQGGVSYNLHGNTDFGKMISGAAALYAGYQFTPVVGLRFGASGWQSRGAVIQHYLPQGVSNLYKYNYIQGDLDVTFDLASLFGGFRHDRVFNPYLFVGVGGNYAFNNDEAVVLKGQLEPSLSPVELEKLWTDSKMFVAGRVGLGADFYLANDYALLGLEVNANMLSDHYNSRRHKNLDWQFNALLSLKFRLGKNYREAAVAPVYAPVETPVAAAPAEEPAPAPAPAPAPKAETPAPAPAPAPATLTTNIFYTLNSATISAAESSKIDELVKFLNENPAAKVTVTGYADAETGSKNYNLTLSQKRADSVASALKKAGIAADRITVEAKGVTVQPFGAANVQNRVTICVAE